MDRYPHRDRDRIRRFAPEIDGLEGRQLLSLFPPISSQSFFPGYTSYGSNQLASRAAIVRHEYDQYVSEVKSLELKSQATSEELLALRDDARSISAAASAANLPAAVASATAADVSLQLDRSPLYGSAKDAGWGVVTTRVTTNLETLGIPQPLIQQTLADMKALATSAGVTPSEFQTFTNDFYMLRDGESQLPSNPYYHFEDPGLFYSQHLRGFFRGWGEQKVTAEARLHRDVQTIQSTNSVETAGVALLHRDTQLLQRLGAAVPSTTNQTLDNAYVAAFTDGVPTYVVQSQLRTTLITILGPLATASRVAMINQLVADSPTFALATDAPSPDVATLVDDVGILVNAGGGQTLNPFNVIVTKSAKSTGNNG